MSESKTLSTFAKLALLIWLCRMPVLAQDKTEYFKSVYCWFPAAGGQTGLRPIGKHPITKEVALAHPWTYCLESWKHDRYRVSVHKKGNRFEPHLELEVTEKPVFKIHFGLYIDGESYLEQTWTEMPSLKKSIRRIQQQRPYAAGQGFSEWDAQGRAVRVVGDVDEEGRQSIEEYHYSDGLSEGTDRKVSALNQQPVKQHDDVFSVYYKFDREGNWILKEYRDAHGRPVAYRRRQPPARMTRSIEDDWKRVELRNFDAQGKPCSGLPGCLSHRLDP